MTATPKRLYRSRTDRKLAGVLVEGGLDPTAQPYAIVGLGLNIAQLPSLPATATSLQLLQPDRVNVPKETAIKTINDRLFMSILQNDRLHVKTVYARQVGLSRLRPRFNQIFTALVGLLGGAWRSSAATSKDAG